MLKSPLRTHALVALLIVALVAVGYAPILGVPFLSDDYGIIKKAVSPGGATDWARVLGDFQGPLFGYRAMYRPLYTLSFALDYSLFGTWAPGYHLTNLVLHAISSFFVYLLALELLARSEWWRGAAITAGSLFALHPIHPESVTWIAGRVDLICAVFYLAAMFLFLRWLRTENSLYLALSLLGFALSLMGKEMAVTLPGLLFLIALYRGTGFKGSVLRTLPFAALLGAYFLFRYFILSGVEANQILARDAGVLEVLQGFVYRTLHMFLPLNLGLVSTPWLEQLLDSAFSFWPLLVVGLLLLVWSRNKLLLSFGLYALSVVPVLPALTRTDHLLTTSRWFYIPSAFLSILVAGLVWSAVANYRRWRLPVAALVCGAFLVMLLANNSIWVQAGEIGEELAHETERPEFPVKYKGAYVFLNEGLWQQAHVPPFRERGNLPRLVTSGEVGAVNLEEERFALRRSSGENMAMRFDPEIIRVEGGGGEASVEDLERGQSVRVVYVVGYEGNLARFIKLRERGESVRPLENPVAPE